MKKLSVQVNAGFPASNRVQDFIEEVGPQQLKYVNKNVDNFDEKYV